VCLALVASGGLDAYLATSLNPEDMAAAVVIIREAGGKVTNLKSFEWKLGDESILAANPELHKKLFEFFGLT
jgi:myo-inositol-1(or 4)-monophosphatase